MTVPELGILAARIAGGGVVRIILTNEDARRYERLMEEEPDVVGIVAMDWLGDAPGGGTPVMVSVGRAASFRGISYETPSIRTLVIEDSDGRIVEQAPEEEVN
jgi:hypothetical protein